MKNYHVTWTVAVTAPSHIKAMALAWSHYKSHVQQSIKDRLVIPNYGYIVEKVKDEVKLPPIGISIYYL